jgi:hypothetical protein
VIERVFSLSGLEALMRNWWLIGGALLPLMGCGMFGDDEDESSDGSEDEEDSEEEELGLESCDGVDFGTLRGGEGGIRSAQDSSKDALGSLMPDTVELLFAIQDIEQVTKDYKDFLDPTRAGDHELGNKIREFHQEIQQELGFDISNLDDWEKTGLDFERPWAIGFHGSDFDQDPAMSFALPLANRKTFREGLDTMLVKDGKSLECTKQQNGQSCGVVGDEDGEFMVLTQEYVVLIKVEGESPDSMISAFLDPSAGKLKDRERFVQIYDRLQGNWNALIWMSEAFPEQFMIDERTASEYRDLEDLNRKYGSGEGTGLWGIGLSASASLEHVEFDMIGGADWLDHFSQYLACSGKDTLGAKLDGDAFAAIRLSQNISGLLKMILEDENVAEEWEVSRESLEDSIGIDVQDDFLMNLDGNISLIGLGDSSPGVLLYMGIKDDEKGAEALTSIYKELLKQDGISDSVKESKVDGNTWYTVQDEGFELGIAEVGSNYLVSFSMGGGQLESIQESLGSGDGDLMDNFSSRSVRTLESGAPYVTLVNIPALVDTVLDNKDFQEQLNLKPKELRQLRKARQLIKSCAGDVMIAGGVNGDAVLGVARLESGSGDFAPCLELALEQQGG